MKARISITPDTLEGMDREVLKLIKGAKHQVEAAMAARYHEIVLANFGESGVDRPIDWPPLGNVYAKLMGRTFATLYVTGALFDSVEIDPQSAKVSVRNTGAVPYALVHQFGGRNTPPRPYFPMTPDGTALPWTVQEVQQAAADALARALTA